MLGRGLGGGSVIHVISIPEAGIKSKNKYSKTHINSSDIQTRSWSRASATLRSLQTHHRKEKNKYTIDAVALTHTFFLALINSGIYFGDNETDSLVSNSFLGYIVPHLKFPNGRVVHDGSVDYEVAY